MEQQGALNKQLSARRAPRRGRRRAGGAMYSPFSPAVGAVRQFVMKILQQDLTFHDRNRKQWEVLTFSSRPPAPFLTLPPRFVSRERPSLSALLSRAFRSVCLASFLSLLCLLSLFLSLIVLFAFRLEYPGDDLKQRSLRKPVLFRKS